MNYFNFSFDDLLNPQTALSVVFAIYLIMGAYVPVSVAHLIDSAVGKLTVIILAIAMLTYSNPILGILGLLVAFMVIKNSSVTTGTAGLELYRHTEEKKWAPFAPAHQFPYTLEQEIVKKMTTQKFNVEYARTPFKPITEDIHSATYLASMQ